MNQINKSLSNIKVEASNDKAISEIAKTNQLLTEIKNIFAPIAEMMKKNMNNPNMKPAYVNNIAQPTISKTSSIIDVRKQG